MPIIDAILDKTIPIEIGDIPQFNKQDMIEDVFTNEINILIEDQLFNLNNLGINYLNQYKLNLIDTSKTNLVDTILFYTHNNYINIIGIESLMQDQITKFVIANYIYDLYSYQLIKKILPTLININTFKSSLDIITKLNLNTLKSNMLKVLYKLCDTIGRLNHTLMIQYTYYIDLFDNNLELFFENFLTPIIIKYEMEINTYAK